MTQRHWLLFAVIVVALVAGALLLVAAGNRPAPGAPVEAAAD